MKRFWTLFIEPVLEAYCPQSIVEIGSDKGINTRNLCGYATKHAAKVHVVDPQPSYNPQDFFEKYTEVAEFHHALSLNFLGNNPVYDVYLIDGDHNWYTVYNELKIIENYSIKQSVDFPLLIFHDTAWPYARRDMYYFPENIPLAFCNPYKRLGIIKGQPELVLSGGINEDLNNSIYEGTQKNGVLTAIEDFIKESTHDLVCITLPIVCGISFLVSKNILETNKELNELFTSFKNLEVFAPYLEFVENNRINHELYHISVVHKSDMLMQQKEHEVLEIKNHFTHLEQRLIDTQNNLAVATAEVDSLCFKCDSLREDKDTIIQQKNAEITEINKQFSHVEQDLMNTQRELVVAINEAESLREKCDALQVEIGRAYNNITIVSERLEGKLATAQAGAHTLREEKDVLCIDIGNLNNKLLDATKSTQTLRREKELAHAQVLALHNSLSWRITSPLRILYDVFTWPFRKKKRFDCRNMLYLLRYNRFGSVLYESIFPQDVKDYINKKWSRADIAQAQVYYEQHVRSPLSALPMQELSTANVTKHILFISGEPGRPGEIYRVFNAMQAAQKASWQVDYVALHDLDSIVHSHKLFSIVVIWRAPWSETLASVVQNVRTAGAKIIFDVDDLMIVPEYVNAQYIDAIRSNKLNELSISSMYSKIRATMLEADCCFTTTNELAHYMRRANKIAYVLPNTFTESTFKVSRAAYSAWRSKKNDDYIRIGYAAGSYTHQKDFLQAVDAIASILIAYDHCRLVLPEVSHNGKSSPLINIDEYPALSSVKDKIEWRNLRPLAELPWELARYDINIAPLEFGNPFCESKSNLKFFEAALVEVPTIASPAEPFCSAITHGKNGFLACSTEDWLHYLRILVEDAGLRDKMGKAAFMTTLAEYGPHRFAVELSNVLTELDGGIVGAQAFALRQHILPQHYSSFDIADANIMFEKKGEVVADVSVIIPVYNYRQYVTEALQSVFDQTLQLLDLIVVDDCSTDDSLDVVLQWLQKNAVRFNRVLVLKHTANMNISFARNAAFAAAETLYILPLDADNKLKPECCEKLYAALHPTRASFVYAKIQKFENEDGLISFMPYAPQRLVAGNYIDALALIAREAWALVGGYKSKIEGWEDYDLWCHMAENSLFGLYCPEVLSYYRVHAKSKLRTETKNRYAGILENMYKWHSWLKLPGYEGRAYPTLPTKLLSREEFSRLDEILPHLQCPSTGKKLCYTTDRKAVQTYDGRQKWPVVQGRPVFTEYGEDVKIMPYDHISHELSEEVKTFIESADGLVLHLSAGGTSYKPPHVIEVEYALFGNTDIVADAHTLPFDDAIFSAVVVLNAFEHYQDPKKVAQELFRVLKPGGGIYILTAFMQPLHEAPHHYYNCTKYGLQQWFIPFEEKEISVASNFNPNYTLAWCASEMENSLREDVSSVAANIFANAPMKDFINFRRDAKTRQGKLWKQSYQISQKNQENLAAGFKYIGKKPNNSSGIV